MVVRFLEHHQFAFFPHHIVYSVCAFPAESSSIFNGRLVFLEHPAPSFIPSSKGPSLLHSPSAWAFLLRRSSSVTGVIPLYDQLVASPCFDALLHVQFVSQGTYLYFAYSISDQRGEIACEMKRVVGDRLLFFLRGIVHYDTRFGSRECVILFAVTYFLTERLTSS